MVERERSASLLGMLGSAPGRGRGRRHGESAVSLPQPSRRWNSETCVGVFSLCPRRLDRICRETQTCRGGSDTCRSAEELHGGKLQPKPARPGFFKNQSLHQTCFDVIIFFIVPPANGDYLRHFCTSFMCHSIALSPFTLSYRSGANIQFYSLLKPESQHEEEELKAGSFWVVCLCFEPENETIYIYIYM